jgi:hypothetical protein
VPVERVPSKLLIVKFPVVAAEAEIAPKLMITASDIKIAPKRLNNFIIHFPFN